MKWLLKSKLYIHYLNIDHIYWAIADIIDEVVEPKSYEENRVLKNNLYKLIKENMEEFTLIFYKYSFPNLKREKFIDFYKEIKEKIEQLNINNNKYELISLLDANIDEKKSCFLVDNKDNLIVDDYSCFYFAVMCKYKDSCLYFDRETYVQKKLSDLLEKNKVEFCDSKNNKLIQISDCVIGIISRFIFFLNTHSFEEISSIILNSQLEGFKLFLQLIIKTELFDEKLIQNVAPNELAKKSEFFCLIIQEAISKEEKIID